MSWKSLTERGPRHPPSSPFRSSLVFPLSSSVTRPHPSFFLLILFARIAKMRVTHSFCDRPRDKVFSLTFTERALGGGKILEVSIEDGEFRRNVVVGNRTGRTREKEVSVFLMLVKLSSVLRRPMLPVFYGYINIRIKNGLHARRHTFGDLKRKYFAFVLLS